MISKLSENMQLRLKAFRINLELLERFRISFVFFNHLDSL